MVVSVVVAGFHAVYMKTCGNRAENGGMKHSFFIFR